MIFSPELERLQKESREHHQEKIREERENYIAGREAEAKSRDIANKKWKRECEEARKLLASPPRKGLSGEAKWKYEQKIEKARQLLGLPSTPPPKPKDDNFTTYTFTVPASPLGETFLMVLTSIIGVVGLGGILCGVFGHFWGILGYIGGALAGAFLGGAFGVVSAALGKKFPIPVIILGLLGGGLYLARSHIAPLFSSVNGEELPVSEAAAALTADVNFRAEPSAEGVIIRTLKQGDAVTLTGKVSGGWTQIEHNGDTGWVSSDYVK